MARCMAKRDGIDAKACHEEPAQGATLCPLHLWHSLQWSRMALHVRGLLSDAEDRLVVARINKRYPRPR